MQNLLNDLRFALRQIRRAPGFAFMTVLTLALAIAANSTILSWISSTLLNPVPAANPAGEMVTLMQGEKSDHPSPPLSYPDFTDLRKAHSTLSGFTGYHDDYASITDGGTPERVYTALTSADYFEVLGVQPILGSTYRSTQPNEHDGAAQVVLGYGLWQRHFGGDPNIVGKTVQINLHPYTILGVAPRDFIGCKTGLRTEMFIPLGMDHQLWGGGRIDRRGQSWLNILAVLRPGVNRRSAENELNVLMQRIVHQYPTDHQGNNTITLDPMWRTPFGVNVYLAGTLPILMALAVVLLLLACANVANLLLVRSVGRRREFAIRLSIGAGRWPIVRQLMVENLVLAAAAAGAALLCTNWTARMMTVFLPTTSLPLAMRGRLDVRVMAITVGITLVTAFVSGAIPAWRASHLVPGAVLKGEGAHATGSSGKMRLSSALVVTQVALSMLLLACAGLFVRSLQRAQAVDPGFDPTNVVLATFDLDPMGYTAATGTQFQRRLVARVQQIPGVTSATLADFSPLSFTIHSEGILPDGYLPRPHEDVEADRGTVGPGYLTTMRTPLLSGRDFVAADDASAQPVAIVNQALADHYWPGQNAIGKRVALNGKWLSVVGVTANGKYRRIGNQFAPTILLPLAQHYQSEVILHVRATRDADALAHSIAGAVAELNPNLPLFNVTTLRQSMQLGSVFERIAVAFAGSFGLLALGLAAIGIYGVVSYTARQRTHEIGIRIALGADKGRIFRQVLAQGSWLAVGGLAAGLLVSLALTRFLRGMLFGVGETDWITFATVSLVLYAVAQIACWVPARRAASTEPMQALRNE